MKKLITKLRHKLIRALGGEIPVPIKQPPLIITETVPLTVIKAEQKIPAHRSISMRLENKIGEEIVKACGVQKHYNAVEDIYTFSVAVEVTERSFKKEGENES